MPNLVRLPLQTPSEQMLRHLTSWFEGRWRNKRQTHLLLYDWGLLYRPASPPFTQKCGFCNKCQLNLHYCHFFQMEGPKKNRFYAALSHKMSDKLFNLLHVASNNELFCIFVGAEYSVCDLATPVLLWCLGMSESELRELPVTTRRATNLAIHPFQLSQPSLANLATHPLPT